MTTAHSLGQANAFHTDSCGEKPQPNLVSKPYDWVLIVGSTFPITPWTHHHYTRLLREPWNLTPQPVKHCTQQPLNQLKSVRVVGVCSPRYCCRDFMGGVEGVDPLSSQNKLCKDSGKDLLFCKVIYVPLKKKRWLAKNNTPCDFIYILIIRFSNGILYWSVGLDSIDFT